MKPLQVQCFSSSRGSRGVALVIVLILLLVMTVLGIASIRGTVLEERMSGNMYDRSLAFQAAEAALREGEALVLAGGLVVPAADCSNGVCATPIPTAGVPERWENPSFTGWRVAVVNVGSVATAPEFIIEDMGLGTNELGCDSLDEGSRSPTCQSPRFRVTARSAAADRAQVFLQTMLSIPN